MKFVISALLSSFFALWPFEAAMSQPARAAKEWTHLSAPPAEKARAIRQVQPVRGEMFRLTPATLREKLAKVGRGEAFAARTVGSEMELPMPDGTLERFAIVESSVMAPELAAKFPELKTYAGQGIDDPSATVRLDYSPAGFHAQILSPRGAVYVDPAYRGDASLYVSYFKRDFRKSLNDWKCLAEGTALAGKGTAGSGISSGIMANKTQSGTTLRTFRLAVACTGEYAAYFGGTVMNAMAAIVSAVNRVNGVYETELAVRLVLVANNNLIIYTNAGSDPYSNDNGSAMLSENQANLTSEIGSANYDIGHVFSTDLGGVAILGSVCDSTYKAQGVTGSPAPTGDPFWIDYVAHEMGHQFGANHTFNATSGSCGGGNRNASTAFEPGSGLTIMAYAGICSPDDLQSNSDPYFHAGSLDEIQTFLAGDGGCSVNSATGNSAPTVNGGANYTIPASTPFVLTATGSDPNNDPLTYCWEEMDAGAAAALTDADNGSMALFRNFPPTNNPVRYFPKLSSVLANTNWNQEKLPTTGRTMNFRVTARDNRVGGGGVADSDITVTSVGGAGPFVVTAPNTAVAWSGARTVTWNVASTTSLPINASGVNIFLSTNGGLAFPFLLATNVPNNGSAAVVLPNLISSQARIRVQGAGNIFYDVSDVNFSISLSSPIPLVQLSGTTLLTESCLPTNGAVDPYETVTVNWTLLNAGTAPTTNLVATLLTSNGVYYPGAAQNYGVIPVGGTVTRPFTFIPAGICGGSVTGMVKLVDGAANMGTVSQKFNLGSIQGIMTTQIFQNVSSISIPSSGTATPYPSTITVSGVTNPVVKFTARLNGLTHTFPDDVDVLLVNSNAQTVMLMSGCGSSNDISGVNLTFDDAAASQLPSTSGGGQILPGTYRPSNFYSDTLNPPAPADPYGTTLTPLAVNPNGQWKLFIQDFEPVDLGSLSNGWTLTFITSNSVLSCCTSFPAPTLTTTTWSNKVVRFSWSALPGPHYQAQYRTNLTLGSWVNLGPSLLGTNTTMSITDSVSNAPVRFYRVLVGP